MQYCQEKRRSPLLQTQAEAVFKGGKTTSKKPSLFGKTRRKKNKPKAKTETARASPKETAATVDLVSPLHIRARASDGGKEHDESKNEARKTTDPLILSRGHMRSLQLLRVSGMELEERRVEAESRRLREGHSEEVETNSAEPNDEDKIGRAPAKRLKRTAVIMLTKQRACP